MRESDGFLFDPETNVFDSNDPVVFHSLIDCMEWVSSMVPGPVRTVHVPSFHPHDEVYAGVRQVGVVSRVRIIGR